MGLTKKDLVKCNSNDFFAVYHILTSVFRVVNRSLHIEFDTILREENKVEFTEFSFNINWTGFFYLTRPRNEEIGLFLDDLMKVRRHIKLFDREVDVVPISLYYSLYELGFRSYINPKDYKFGKLEKIIKKSENSLEYDCISLERECIYKGN